MKRTLLVPFLCLLCGRLPSADLVPPPSPPQRVSGDTIFPAAEWEEAGPESQGMDSAKLREAVAFLEANAGKDGARELIVVRRGRLIWKGDNVDHVHGIWSCTKSFTSTVLGLLIAGGRCSLDTQAATVLPELRPVYSGVTLRHFTTMTSGYRAVGDETTGGYTHGPSSTPFRPHPEPLFAPGSAYAYWDSAMNEFGHALTRIAGEPLDILFKRRIADPIGMNPAAWKWGDFQETQGLRINGGSGNAGKHIQISARELARFGHLFLNEGRWNGVQLLPSEWVRAATSVQVPAATKNAWPLSGIAGPGYYGFNWWRNAPGPDGKLLWPEAPVTTFAALGHNNNKLIVVPDWEMVIVRLGLDEGQKKISDEAVSGFLGKVAGALVRGADSNPAAGAGPAPVTPRKADGSGALTLGGALKEWHKVTLTLDGPFAHERDREPNPFTDLAFTVTFTHESGTPRHIVPGYFAADGGAADTGAESGTKWRAHLSPGKPGRWNYAISFTRGPNAALDGGGAPLAPFDGHTGVLIIAPTDKTGRDFRSKGRLEYVGKHHLQFAGSKEFFIKAGPDAPETLLACVDFDGTEPGRARPARPGEAAPAPSLKTWQPHVRDWRPNDPTWQGGKGKGLIGALNYLAAKGLNTFSFLPYNAGGDGDNVWPFVARGEKLHYDCSKLDQWGMVFDHATALGLHLHFKLQETEMDDERVGDSARPGVVPEALDGGALGTERKLYCRELISRFGHALALTWNLGEENTQSAAEQRAMAQFIRGTDPYDHPIVVHTFPGQQETVYRPLLGAQSQLNGASLQNEWDRVHERTLEWVGESARSGRPWVVCNDEQGPASLGVPPDPGYEGQSGIAKEKNRSYTLDDVRKLTLWGNLMAGGAGVEYYFGYQLPQNDLRCEDWRSRDRSWDHCRIALEFFRAEKVPFWEMRNANPLVGNSANSNEKFCFAKPGELYLVYLPRGGTTDLDLVGAGGDFAVKWFDPRSGGALRDGGVAKVQGGGKVRLGRPPADIDEDWLIVVVAQATRQK